MDTSTAQGRDGSLLRGLLVGALVGGVAAWLLAAQSGAEARARVRAVVDEYLVRTEATLRLMLTGSTDSPARK